MKKKLTTSRVEVLDPSAIQQSLAKILNKRKLTPEDRREAKDLAWVLKQALEEQLKHKCEDFGALYMEKALRTEKTRAFIVDEDGKPNLFLSQLMHAAIGMATEAGEVLDALKKSIIYGRPVDVANILEEAGDEKWYLALLLRTIGSTDREAGEKNIKKLLIRYPEKFSGEQAVTRNVALERAVFEDFKTKTSK